MGLWGMCFLDDGVMENGLMKDRVRYAQQVTAFPAGITTGSTWDTSLMYARGNALGWS